MEKNEKMHKTEFININSNTIVNEDLNFNQGIKAVIIKLAYRVTLLEKEVEQLKKKKA